MKKKQEIIKIVIISLAVIILFSFINTKVYKNKYNNIDNYYYWLTANSVKFTNSWLEEGAFNLKFIMYQNQPSIEFATLEDREPYISYPSGSIIIPYAIAQVLHLDQIDHIFIKYMVTVMYAIDSILIGILCYCIMKKFIKNDKFRGYTIISILLAFVWMILPNISYYMRNIYFADQAVITFVLVFMLLELYKEQIRDKCSKIIKLIFNCIYYFIIVFGALTDYYFLFVLFIAFCLKAIPKLFDKTIEVKKRIKNTVKNSLEYIIPLVIAISIFILQINQIDNWQGILLNKFLERTSYKFEHLNSFAIIIEHIINIFTLKGAVILLIGYCFMIAMSVICLIKIIKKNPDKILTEKCKIGIFVYIPPIMQIVILANHSAVHEFSTIKLGLPFIFTAIMIGELLSKIISKFLKKKENLILLISIILIIVLQMAVIVPRANSYTRSRKDVNNYELEYYLRENAKFEEVYVSFDYEIATNPPTLSSISGKNVYRIQDITDIYEKFPNLSKETEMILVVKKKNAENFEKKYEKIVELEKFELYKIQRI